MPAEGTGVAYRAVISACPVVMNHPIVLSIAGKATRGCSSPSFSCIRAYGGESALARRRTGKWEEAQKPLITATTMYHGMRMQFWLQKAETAMR